MKRRFLQTYSGFEIANEIQKSVTLMKNNFFRLVTVMSLLRVGALEYSLLRKSAALKARHNCNAPGAFKMS